MTKKTIIAMAGLPASGKSAIASRLHSTIDSVLLDKDHVRDSLFQQYVDYSRQQNDLCVELMYQSASYLLSKENPPFVIIDGRSYSRKSQINALKQLVANTHCRLCLIECVCSTETAKARLQQDFGVHTAKDRDYAMYSRSRASAEPIEEPRLILDTDELCADECSKRALAYVVATS